MSETRYTNNGRYFIRYQYNGKRAKALILDNIQELDEDKVNKSLSNLNKGYSTKGVSKRTSSKIKQRVRILNFIAEQKKVRDCEGRFINSKLSFVTLTLPSKQVHEDTFLNKNVLGHFLDRCRKLGLLTNYVWKAEKQKNGNIHYHILTDSYITKTIAYRLWLISLEKFGYVSRYTEKFISMDLKAYKKQKFNAKRADGLICKAYYKNSKNGWRLPPCFNVVNLKTAETVEKYISKYMAKEDLENENIVRGRVWGCSSSLNEALKEFKENAEFNKLGYELARYTLHKEVYNSDYYDVILYPISKFFVWFPGIGNEMITILRSIVPPCDFHKRV